MKLACIVLVLTAIFLTNDETEALPTRNPWLASDRGREGTDGLGVPTVVTYRQSSSSSGSSSTGTEGLNRRCSSNWMSKAGKFKKSKGWKISMRPTLRARTLARTSGAWKSMWRDLKACVPFPRLSRSERSSLYKQMICHAKWGLTPLQGGRTWDFESWRPNISTRRATSLKGVRAHKCNWT